MTHSEAGTGLQPDKPNAARMFDYYLGGKDNFAADRARPPRCYRSRRGCQRPPGRAVA
ncbi:hypothetical protein GCM10027614_01350 [Micromonospora vulcania]